MARRRRPWASCAMDPCAGGQAGSWRVLQVREAAVASCGGALTRWQAGRLLPPAAAVSGLHGCMAARPAAPSPVSVAPGAKTVGEALEAPALAAASSRSSCRRSGLPGAGNSTRVGCTGPSAWLKKPVASAPGVSGCQGTAEGSASKKLAARAASSVNPGSPSSEELTSSQSSPKVLPGPSAARGWQAAWARSSGAEDCGSGGGQGALEWRQALPAGQRAVPDMVTGRVACLGCRSRRRGAPDWQQGMSTESPGFRPCVKDTLCMQAGACLPT